jgi:hypothetical protein
VATNVNDGTVNDVLVAVAGSGVNLNNYAITITQGSLTITPAPLRVGGLTAMDKLYDGNVNAIVTGSPTFQGIIAGDVVGYSGSVTKGAFASPAVNDISGTTVNPNFNSLELTNTNYYIQGMASPLTALINPRLTPPTAPSDKGSAPEQLLMNRVANNQGLVATPVAQVNASNVALNQVQIKTEGAGLTILISHQTATGSSFELLKVVNSNSLVYEVPNALLNNVNAQPEKVLSYEAKLEDGNALPAWLKFDARSKTFSASSVPANALPLKVRVLAMNKDKTLAEKIITINKVQ